MNRRALKIKKNREQEQLDLPPYLSTGAGKSLLALLTMTCIPILTSTASYVMTAYHLRDVTYTKQLEKVIDAECKRLDRDSLAARYFFGSTGSRSCLRRYAYLNRAELDTPLLPRY